MKIINKIAFIIITLFAASCKSQTNVIDLVTRCSYLPLQRNNGTMYLKDISNIYSPYIGTWKWSEGNKEMILVLLKQTKFHYNTAPENYYEDRLVGYYIYKENGVMIADTSGENLTSDYGVSVSFHTNCDSQEISTSIFTDVKKKKMITVVLKMITTTQMKFEGKVGLHSSYINGTKERTLYSGSTFPLDMVFTKQ